MGRNNKVKRNNTMAWVMWIMFLIMFTAKVFGFITWSWWTIAAPLWLPVSVMLLVVMVLYTTSGLFPKGGIRL